MIQMNVLADGLLFLAVPIGPGSLYLAGLICKWFFMDLFWHVGFLSPSKWLAGPSAQPENDCLSSWNGRPEMGCLGLVNWLAGPEAQQEIGCQI
jgi:hypothetical protein